MPKPVPSPDRYGCAISAVATACDVSYAQALAAIWPNGKPKRGKNFRVASHRFAWKPDDFPGVYDLRQIERGLRRLGFRGECRINGKLGTGHGEYINSHCPRLNLRDLRQVTILCVKEGRWIWTHCRVWDPASGTLIDPYWQSGASIIKSPEEHTWRMTEQNCFWHCPIERLDGKAIPAYAPAICL